MTASPIDRRLFRRTCSLYATGVTVVTIAADDGSPHGMTANSFTSVSAEPPLVLICVDHRARIMAHIRTGSHFAINVLGEEHEALSAKFASGTGDRFDGVAWTPGTTGAPLLPEMLAHFECAVWQTIEAGDHSIVIGEVLRAEAREGRPLCFFGSGYRRLAL